MDTLTPEHYALIEALQAAPDEVLLAILQRVFADRTLTGTDVPIVQSHFFLGSATRLYEQMTDGTLAWEPWEIHAIAYPDFATYNETYNIKVDAEWVGPDYGFSQFAICRTCGTQLYCNLKQGICPICNTSVYLT